MDVSKFLQKINTQKTPYPRIGKSYWFVMFVIRNIILKQLQLLYSKQIFKMTANTVQKALSDSNNENMRYATD